MPVMGFWGKSCTSKLDVTAVKVAKGFDPHVQELIRIELETLD